MLKALFFSGIVLVCLTAAERPTIGAIYFGDWHVDVQHAELHGPNWTEWQLPIRATPRYPHFIHHPIPTHIPLTPHPHPFGYTFAPLQLGIRAIISPTSRWKCPALA
jgi:hypothetical protein